jgi:ABC-type bacteriocin/lantibiotic exporter with double-glycine peptidase domain
MLEVIMITFIILLFFSFSYIAEKPLNNYFELMGVFLFASLRITPLAYNIFSSLSQIFSSWYAVTELANEFNIIEQAKNKTVKFNQNSNLVNLSSIKKISLNNISFNYGLNSKKILNDINLEIHKGTCIGIKGASGSGKTTLINIILGLLKPSNGEIMVNENFQYFQTNIQDRMSYTPQDIFLVKGSILDNIALGQSKTDIDKENLYYSTMNSQILQFIEGKDVSKDIMQILDNYNVENLSGGQAQRIAIARNLYFKKDINVFDEFTSALDVKIEDKIVSHLHKIKENKIIIIVSHRMNAMKHCDIIYELKEGKLEKM